MLWAQDDLVLAQQQINDLKKGILVVVLPTVLDDIAKFRDLKDSVTQFYKFDIFLFGIIG